MTFFFLSFDFVTVFTFISYMSATFVMELKKLGILLNDEMIKILLFDKVRSFDSIQRSPIPQTRKWHRTYFGEIGLYVA